MVLRNSLLILAAFVSSVFGATWVNVGKGSYAEAGGTGPFEITGGTAGQVWGGTTFPRGDPTNRYYYDGRGQFVILAAELAAAGVTTGDITGIDVRCNVVPGTDLLNFRIRMQHTAATTSTAMVTSTWTVVYGPVTVTTSSFTAAAWTTFTFSTPFTWNGSSNLLIDFSVDNTSTFAANGGLYMREMGTNRLFTNWADNTEAWPFDTNANSEQLTGFPEIRFRK